MCKSETIYCQWLDSEVEKTRLPSEYCHIHFNQYHNTASKCLNCDKSIQLIQGLKTVDELIQQLQEI